jgi:hypothetical protein
MIGEYAVAILVMYESRPLGNGLPGVGHCFFRFTVAQAIELLEAKTRDVLAL